MLPTAPRRLLFSFSLLLISHMIYSLTVANYTKLFIQESFANYMYAIRTNFVAILIEVRIHGLDKNAAV